MHRFFVDDSQIEESQITITGEDVNHIINVLRLLIGDEIIISNRQGKEYCCIIDSMERDKVRCIIQTIDEALQELSAKIYLFQGLPKQDKMELIIQKSIELGVYEIIPVSMARTIVKINENNKNKKNERWQKIAMAAAKQSHRGIIPNVHEPMTFDAALKFASQLDTIIVPYENALNIKDSKKLLSNLSREQSIGIFIGPEGGFEEQEITRLGELKASIISLGKRILRTETAGLVILSILMFNLEEE